VKRSLTMDAKIETPRKEVSHEDREAP
jgi:hypothetical protein